MSLPDCFMDLFAHGLSFRRSLATGQPDYEGMRDAVMRMLTESEEAAARAGIRDADYDLARYAVCAWMDELVLSSEWSAKQRWRAETLQRVYYRSADAGTKIFERLEKLEPAQQDVREVYFLCLALGFKGRYCGTEDAYLLELVKEKQLKILSNGDAELMTVAGWEKQRLFPDGILQAPLKPSSKWTLDRRLFLGSVIAAPAVITVGLFIVYYATLANVAGTIVRMVKPL